MLKGWQKFMSKKVLILGVEGMLGHTCFDYFNGQSDFQTFGTWRKADQEKVKFFDATNCSVEKLISDVQPDWIINCIGVIKQKINENDPISIENTLRINQEFPHEIARAVAETKTRVIQIATDCVFNGEIGNYSEESRHDALDLYGKSKSLGEIQAKEFINLRVSIIGREIETNLSLADWFLSQDDGAKVNGFQNHMWNGITTIAFSRIAAGIVRSRQQIFGTMNIVPNDQISKFELLQLLGKYFDRGDIGINPSDAPIAVDRTLCTIYPELNRAIWKSAGYEAIPSIKELIEELADCS